MPNYTGGGYGTAGANQFGSQDDPILQERRRRYEETLALNPWMDSALPFAGQGHEVRQPPTTPPPTAQPPGATAGAPFDPRTNALTETMFGQFADRPFDPRNPVAAPALPPPPTRQETLTSQGFGEPARGQFVKADLSKTRGSGFGQTWNPAGDATGMQSQFGNPNQPTPAGGTVSMGGFSSPDIDHRLTMENYGRQVEEAQAQQALGRARLPVTDPTVTGRQLGQSEERARTATQMIGSRETFIKDYVERNRQALAAAGKQVPDAALIAGAQSAYDKAVNEKLYALQGRQPSL